MAKIIEFDLSPNGIDDALKEVREMQTWIDTKRVELIRRLSEIGVQVARVNFTGAEYAGTNDVSVSVSFGTNTAEIRAQGRAVAFIEFGSGVTRGGGYPGDKNRVGASPIGTYGEGRGASGKAWVYEGEKGTSGHEVYDKNGNVRPGIYQTKGNPPAMAMYKAAREIESDFLRIAREVFG